jgi:hypothetical protein
MVSNSGININMAKILKKREILLKIGPSDKPYAKLYVKEKRKGLEDRRKLKTYIANDRRSGIADRRKERNGNG